MIKQINDIKIAVEVSHLDLVVKLTALIFKVDLK